MSGETTAALPEDVVEWLERRATETGTEPDELLRDAVLAYQVVEAQGDRPGDEETALDLAGLAEQTATLADRLDALEADLDSKVDDLRARVVQVKRETDAKAPADHSHPDLAPSTPSRETVDRLEADLETLSDKVDAGFENFERVLTYLDDDAAERDERIETLARVFLSLRSRVESLEAAVAEREAVDDLATQANQLDVTAATCEDCGSTVHIGLLASPRCPHCETPFDGVDPARHFFVSATLRTGEPPALEGDAESAETPADLFAEDDDG
jgi:predicted Zn-ribbon and HTH transcriptional regulator